MGLREAVGSVAWLLMPRVCGDCEHSRDLDDMGWMQLGCGVHGGVWML